MNLTAWRHGSAIQLLISLLPYTAELSDWTVHKQGVSSCSLYPRAQWRAAGLASPWLRNLRSLQQTNSLPFWPMLFPGLPLPRFKFAMITITQLPWQGILTPGFTPCSTWLLPTQCVRTQQNFYLFFLWSYIDFRLCLRSSLTLANVT